ncbi:MAG: RNA-binding protein [Gammaproteobacteria bacterium]|nr:RNA-binding protein [Gammaproteobacteria bacterium]
MNKLYVGNLPFTCGDNDLEGLFSSFEGFVSAKVIIDRYSGKSKGFGFVEFTDGNTAQAALSMDGTDFDGRTLKVNLAREKRESGGTGGGSRDRRY